MIVMNLQRRLARLEASARPYQGGHHVIANIGECGAFIGQHERVMTDAEMDTAEAALFATGEAKHGVEVVRIVFRIVDPGPPIRAVL